MDPADPPGTSAATELPDLPVGRPTSRVRLIAPAVLRIELRRVLRNRLLIVFAFALPTVVLAVVGSRLGGSHDALAPGVVADVGAYVMAGTATYGAVVATTSAGASLAIERTTGWTRRLRLTPSRPVSHIALKLVVAVLLSAVATGVSFATGLLTGAADVGAPRSWWLMAVVIVGGSLVFGAFGMFLGSLLPGHAMPLLGPVLAVLAVLGGLATGPVPADSWYGRVAALTPVHGLSQMVHWPLTLTTAGTRAPFEPGWVVDLLAWSGLFVAIAVRRFRRNGSRV